MNIQLSGLGVVPRECPSPAPSPPTRNPSTMLWDVRWQCRGCGRFIPQSAIQERDHVDPSAYYGVRSEWWVDCAKCGPGQDVICVETKPIGYDYT